MKVLLLFLISMSAQASIFYGDDRIDFYEIRDERIQKISRSIPALIQKEKLEKVAGGYIVKTKTLEKLLKFCPEANFSAEYQLANCSTSLIGSDLVMTAAHCLRKETDDDYHPSKYVIVFDYKKTSSDENLDFIPEENVYEVESDIPYYNFDHTSMLDIAIIKLKRKVIGREPLKLNLEHDYAKTTPLFVLGYPLGVSQKLTSDSEIIATLDQPNSFRHHLDTFSVNSGSAIFDASTNEIIGVHVRGTGSNFKKYNERCNDWFIGDPEKDYGEANMLGPIKQEIQNLLKLSL